LYVTSSEWMRISVGWTRLIARNQRSSSTEPSSSGKRDWSRG
jgi:hypothetical protein